MRDPKADLHEYLTMIREAVLWKVDGVSEYDARRPMTPTGTNLLGLVKHLSIVEAWYFGRTFDRPFPEELTWWDDDAEPNVECWVTEHESRAEIVDRYERATAHADATIDALPLDARGVVPWWSSPAVTLHAMLVHVLAETHRHAGHADIVRELVDGAAGLRAGASNLPDGDEAWWADYHARLEAVAARFRA